VEVGGLDVQPSHLIVGIFDAFGVGVLVEAALYG
jgi:hypothetical protein